MTEHDTGSMDDYGRRIGREMYALGTRALRPFDAAGIAHQVAVGHRAAARPFALGGTIRRRWLLVMVVLAATMMLALWAVVGQQPSSPLTFAPGSIAFTRGGDLYVASADGSEQVLIATGQPGNDGQISGFAFAPDRRSIAIADQHPQVRIVAPDGTALGSRGLSGGDTSAWSSWGPGGTELVVASGDETRLVVIGTDGRDRRSIALPDGFSWGWAPDLGSWSPDGRWIAVFGCVAPCDIKFDPHILLVAADGSGSHWLTTETDMTGYTTREAWAPDSRLALANERTSTVEILSEDGATLATATSAHGPVAWSPDGSRMVMGGHALRMVGSDGSVRHVDIDRQPVRPVADDSDPGYISDVGWSADGQLVLFVGLADASPVRSLYAIDPAGGTPRLFIERVDPPGEALQVASAP
jgi:Tol biopolymer transport system component